MKLHLDTCEGLLYKEPFHLNSGGQMTIFAVDLLVSLHTLRSLIVVVPIITHVPTLFQQLCCPSPTFFFFCRLCQKLFLGNAAVYKNKTKRIAGHIWPPGRSFDTTAQKIPGALRLGK